ncbi:MAG: hypothetical protein ACRC6U_09655 [Fusobacteriaceae bacterium]
MKNYEIKASLIGVFIILIFLIDLDMSFYKEFLNIQDSIISITLVIIGIVAGIIGAILTGLGLLISFLSRETRERFGRSNVNKMLNWFRHIAEVSGIYLIFLLGLYIALISEKKLVAPVFIFYLITILYIFGFLYILFYLIAVIRNIVSLFMSNMNFEKVENIEQQNRLLVLTAQQEVTFNLLRNNKLVTVDQLIDTFIFIINSEEDEQKKEYLISFFSKYYGYDFRNQ